jgi:UDP-N-acetylglucosamine--N-acetylmuramyl-(pentapeptide) pyrophosphoryl-undecaprenol N-acetylglucosamine transferase
VIQKVSRETACQFFNLDAKKPILFITGGSLGARVLNESIFKDLNLFLEKDIQLIWQTGQFYTFKGEIPSTVYLKPFLREMNLAYSCADVVISRSGALSCSEIATAEVPAIFVPSANVTDDHQTKNAQHVCKNGGAIMVTDKDAKSNLVTVAIALLSNKSEQNNMRIALKDSARPNATETIVNEIEKFL